MVFTKERSWKHSPDCSGKPTAAAFDFVRLQARTCNGKRDPKSPVVVSFRFINLFVGNLILYFFKKRNMVACNNFVPLSAKSFCSAKLHKKDTAAIGAKLKTSLRQKIIV